MNHVICTCTQQPAFVDKTFKQEWNASTIGCWHFTLMNIHYSLLIHCDLKVYSPSYKKTFNQFTFHIHNCLLTKLQLMQHCISNHSFIRKCLLHIKVYLRNYKYVTHSIEIINMMDNKIGDWMYIVTFGTDLLNRIFAISSTYFSSQTFHRPGSLTYMTLISIRYNYVT